jgi:hypothetical protein
MSSQGNQTPFQLWTSGLLQFDGSGGAVASELFEHFNETNETEDYGVDWDGPCPVRNEDYTVVVPEIQIPDCFNNALEAVDPLSDSTEYGLDLYLRLLNIVTNLS